VKEFQTGYVRSADRPAPSRRRRFRPAALATACACLLVPVSGQTAASATRTAAPTTGSARPGSARTLISPQYYALLPDIKPTFAPGGPAVTGAVRIHRQRVVPRPPGATRTDRLTDSQIPSRASGLGWYRGANCRYQLHLSMQKTCGRTAPGSAYEAGTKPSRSVSGIDARIGLPITGSGQSERTEHAADARILLQLGVGLAVLYVLFLIVWFWATRARVARRHMVRF
jgi:hypothetical protein